MIDTYEGTRTLLSAKRGLHKTFASAVDAASSDLLSLINTHPFDREVAAAWPRIHAQVVGGDPRAPRLVTPGKYDSASGYLTLYVKNSRTLFAMKSKQRAITAALKALPSAPKNLKTVLQIAIG